MIDNDQNIIKSINIYLENVNNSLVLVEVNEPIRQIEIIESIKNKIKDKNILEVDLLNTKLNHLEKVQECIKNDTKNSEIVLVTNLHQISNKIENNINDSELVRDLNFSREPYAKLKKVIVFFLPVYFVDLVIRNAPDFYDFLSVKFRFKSEDKISNEALKIQINDDIDERYVKNRINFLESILEDYGEIDANYINHIIDLSNNYYLLGYKKTSLDLLLSKVDSIDENSFPKHKINLLISLSYFNKENKSLENIKEAYYLYNKFQLQDLSILSRIYSLLGENYSNNNEVNKAIEYLNKSIDLSIHIKDNIIRTYSLLQIFDLYKKEKMYSEALEVSEQLLRLLNNFDNKLSNQVIKVLFGTSEIYLETDKFNQAIQFIEDFYKLNVKLKPKYQSQIKLYLSRLYFDIKDFEKSSSLIDEALKINDVSDIKVYSFYTKGLIDKEKGNYDSSIKYFDKILEITKNEEKKFFLHRYLSYYQLGKIYFNLNQLDLALEYLYESFENLKDKEFYESFDILSKISEIYKRKNKENRYINTLKQAIDYSKKNKNYFIKPLFSLAKFYFHRNKFSSSINYLQKGLRVFNEVESSEYKIKILDLLVKNYEQLKDSKNTIKYKSQLDLLLKESN
jgi:tetratricopeptide (TPR) repeat protein